LYVDEMKISLVDLKKLIIQEQVEIRLTDFVWFRDCCFMCEVSHFI
jgi:hypothetical protein